MNCIFSTECVSDLYILAFTADENNAGVGDLSKHEVEVETSSPNQIRQHKLTGSWANQYTRGKGDLFKFEMSDFGFSGDCIKFQYIKRVSIKAGSNDGWKIDSITTHVKGAEGGKIRVLTVDMDVYRWIDGNDEPAMEQFDLTQVWTPPAEV